MWPRVSSFMFYCELLHSPCDCCYDTELTYMLLIDLATESRHLSHLQARCSITVSYTLVRN